MPKDFWKKKWGPENKCPITQTRLRPGCNSQGVPYTIRLPCKHRFVRSALIEWAKRRITSHQNPSCPMCRRRVGLIDLLTSRN